MATITITPLADSVAKMTADPAAGRSTPTVTAELANGRARLSSGPFNWDADLGPAIGGGNLAPSPTAYMLGALAGCAVAFLGLDLDNLRSHIGEHSCTMGAGNRG